MTILTPDQVSRHERLLATETKTTVEAVVEVTTYFAERLVESARRAQRNAPVKDGEADWLEVAMACNAAPNKNARRLIEHRARVLFNTPTGA